MRLVKGNGVDDGIRAAAEGLAQGTRHLAIQGDERCTTGEEIVRKRPPAARGERHAPAPIEKPGRHRAPDLAAAADDERMLCHRASSGRPGPRSNQA